MKHRGRWMGCAILLVLGASTSRSEAGTFVMMSVDAATVVSSYGYMGVRVDGIAQYQGSVDSGDVDYQINTELNDNRDGGSLYNWSMPDAEGDGLTGHGITQGMYISCTGSCAAYSNLYRLNCPATYNYVGHGAVTVYHPFSSEISTKDTGVRLVGCFTPPPPPPDGGGGWGGGGGVCGSGAVTTATMASVNSGAMLAAVPGFSALTRRDVQGHMRYLLEDWAVLSVTPAEDDAPTIKVLNASSPPFGDAAAARLRAQATKASGTVLVVESAEHPRNSRWIPTPRARMVGPSFSGGAPGEELVVRADFTDSGRLGRLDVLHSTEPVPGPLVDQIKQHLEMVYQSPKRHRAIAFVILRLGDSVAIRSSVTVVPLCCCGSEGNFCV